MVPIIDGTGSLGLACLTADSFGYEFVVNEAGLAGVYSRNTDPTKPDIILKSYRVPRWSTAARHELSAVCLAGSTSTSLEFIVDGRSVVQTNDSTYAATLFTPAAYIESDHRTGVDVNLVHFRVESMA